MQEKGPSPIEFMKTTVESNRSNENAKKTQEITKKLIQNSSVFGGQIEEEKSQLICQEIFANLGTKYQPDKSGSMVGGIELTLKNPSASDVQKNIAKENLIVLSRATFRAINFSFRDYPNGLITSALTAEQINDFLPVEMKGLGKYVMKIDSVLNDDGKKTILDINESVSEVIKDKTKIREFFGKINGKIKGKPEGCLEKQYGELAISVVLENNNIETGKRPRKGDVDYTPLVEGVNGEVEGGARWEISPEYAAEAMKFMDAGMRWQSYTPPEWMKKLDGETQARIEYMIMINDGAAGLSYAGKDLDKIQGNKMYFAFDNEKMTKLFNPDFKLVMSKMLNDLCELYTDKNGQQCIRYKEGLNSRKKEGIQECVEKHLENIRGYKEELADFLAKQNKRKEPNYMDKMNAYTAWNLFYMFGDSSVADRRRVLPTYGGIISDALRTLNPEYKALKKWNVSKADIPQSDLEGAEWFGGPLGTYVQTVMQLERDLGENGKDKAITGNKTLRKKMIDGDLSILNTKTFYGFLDFTSGGRDLFDKNEKKFYEKDKDGNVKVDQNKKETLSSLLMNYASFDSDGKLISKNENGEFSFGTNQVDFLNEYRDQMEASVLVLNATTGKEDVRDIGKFVSKIRTVFGMVDGIEKNGEHLFMKYTRNPDLWANILLGSFGVDTTRLSTDCIYVRTTQPRAYNLNLGSFLTRGLRLTENDVDLLKLMRRLGMDIKDGENYDSLAVTIRNEIKWKQSKKETDDLYRKIRKN